MVTTQHARQRRTVVLAVVAQAVLTLAVLASYLVDDRVALAGLRTLALPVAGLTAGVLVSMLSRPGGGR